MRYFDIHSHINDSRFDTDRAEVIERMREKEVAAIIVGTDQKMSEDAVKIAREHPGLLFAAVGLHPTDNRKEEFDVNFYESLARDPATVVIGECGLDYFHISGNDVESEKLRQKKVFEDHIELAIRVSKPLMIHCRDAHPDMLAVLASKKKEYGDRLRGNIHFFSEGAETAKKYFDLDFTVSFTGVITFTTDYDEAVRYAPQEMILSETDCPYVAPVPFRGKRNEPIYVEEVVKRIAEIRGEELETVKNALVDNAKRVFGVSIG